MPSANDLFQWGTLWFGLGQLQHLALLGTAFLWVFRRFFDLQIRKMTVGFSLVPYVVPSAVKVSYPLEATGMRCRARFNGGTGTRPPQSHVVCSLPTAALLGKCSFFAVCDPSLRALVTSWKVCEPARLQHIGWILCAQGFYCWADGSLTTRTLQAGPSRCPPSAVLLESASRFTSLLQLCYTQVLLTLAGTRKIIVVGSRQFRETPSA